MKIMIPVTPAAELSPNSRCHWRVKSRAVKQLRTAAHWSARLRCGGGPVPVFAGPVTVRATIAWEPRRRMLDSDNALGCLKSAFDGLQDARVVENDKQMTFLPVVQVRDKDKRGYVEIEIEEATR